VLLHVGVGEHPHREHVVRSPVRLVIHHLGRDQILGPMLWLNFFKWHKQWHIYLKM
jgi:hypothetical protein